MHRFWYHTNIRGKEKHRQEVGDPNQGRAGPNILDDPDESLTHANPRALIDDTVLKRCDGRIRDCDGVRSGVGDK